MCGFNVEMDTLRIPSTKRVRFIIVHYAALYEDAMKKILDFFYTIYLFMAVIVL